MHGAADLGPPSFLCHHKVLAGQGQWEPITLGHYSAGKVTSSVFGSFITLATFCALFTVFLILVLAKCSSNDGREKKCVEEEEEEEEVRNGSGKACQLEKHRSSFLH